MRKVNFNNIENLEIPDAWVEKALNFPSESKQKKNVFAFPSLYRKLSYVACFVFLCALSVALFSFAKNDDILPVKYPDTIATQNTKTETFNNKETQNSISKNPTNPPTENVEETHQTTEDNSTQNATSTAPTQNPDPPQIETTPDDGTLEPEDQPSNPNGYPDPPGQEAGGVSIGFVPESALCGSTTVYCYIVSDSENITSAGGEPTKYPAKVTIIGNGYAIVSFEGYKSVDALFSGPYNFYYLNINGDVIFEETIYVTVK